MYHNRRDVGHPDIASPYNFKQRMSSCQLGGGPSSPWLEQCLILHKSCKRFHLNGQVSMPVILGSVQP